MIFCFISIISAVLASELLILNLNPIFKECSKECYLNSMIKNPEIIKTNDTSVTISADSIESSISFKGRQICKFCLEICKIIKKIDGFSNLIPVNTKVGKSHFTLLKSTELGFLGINCIRTDSNKNYLVSRNSDERYPKYCFIDFEINQDFLKTHSRIPSNNADSVIFVFSFGYPDELKQLKISEVINTSDNRSEGQNKLYFFFLYFEIMKFILVVSGIFILIYKLRFHMRQRVQEYEFSKLEKSDDKSFGIIDINQNQLSNAGDN